jgi:hypothetical protein
MALKMTTSQADEVLRTWQSLNARIMSLDLDETKLLLEREQLHQRRLRVMLRLYSRYSRLRSIKEKAELGKLALG